MTTAIHDLETGAKEPSVDVARRLDAALKAGGELTALVAADTSVRRRDFIAAAGLAVALPATHLAHSREIDSQMPAQLVARTARLRRLDLHLRAGSLDRAAGGVVARVTEVIPHSD